ncbi:MAG TPA: hypothetical protein VHT50_30640, partial [Mycobacterium sp.]|nr:hypothetical protein [Mycobacterium sp.]
PSSSSRARRPPPRTSPTPQRSRTGHRLPQELELLATGYRGLLDRFPNYLDTIVKLKIYRTS